MVTGSMETLSWPFPGWAWTQAHLLVLCLCGLGIWGDVWVVILGVSLHPHAYLGKNRDS